MATYSGRHYETGAIANALRALPAINPRTELPYSEALAFGASGGIAFGQFVFEYKGQLPHAAILTRNTFSPFDRCLDNMAIRREVRETTDDTRAEKNLRSALDDGHFPLVWADVFSMPYRGLNPTQMWHMQPILVVGYEGSHFMVVDGTQSPFPLEAEILANARARVKKDRFRMMVLEAPATERLAEGLRAGIRTATALYLDKPPAGSVNNFGVQGFRHWAKLLRDLKGPKTWRKSFDNSAKVSQALAGTHGQPGVWDCIQIWGTGDRGDRATFAAFLRETAEWTSVPELADIGDGFDDSAAVWQSLAEAALPSDLPHLLELKQLKIKLRQEWFERGPDSNEDRAEMRNRIREIVLTLGASEWPADIFDTMANRVDEIEAIETPLFERLRGVVG